MNYPSDIHSIAHMHPALANNPHFINVPNFQGIHSSKAVGNPLDPSAVREAEETAQILSTSQSEKKNQLCCSRLYAD
jgi:hypothetical protein